uniref:POU domain protein n=1 Tax=Trichuris muris TaxID=70415 RepID=A0A5S6QH65_TRIMR
MAGVEKYPSVASAFQMSFGQDAGPVEQSLKHDKSETELICLERLPHSASDEAASAPSLYSEVPCVGPTLTDLSTPNPELVPSENAAVAPAVPWEFKMSSPLTWWNSSLKCNGQPPVEQISYGEQAPQSSPCSGRSGFCESSNELLYNSACDEPCSSLSAQRISDVGDSLLQMEEDMNVQRSPGDGTVAIEELESFARYFKKTRIRLGFTQGDVGCAMGRLYNFAFSQTTISRFEALNLSFKNMCKLKPRLERWLIDTEETLKNGTFDCKVLKASIDTTVCPRRRKRRTNIEGKMRDILEREFQICNRPHPSRLEELANELCLDREVVRVWFCNRRQKEKKECRDCLNEMAGRKCSVHACGFLVYTHDSRLPIGGTADTLSQISEGSRRRP